MSYLVTGGTGFIGSNVVNRLTKQRKKTLILTRKRIKKKNIIQTDLTKKIRKLPKDIDIIYHCAGQLGGFNATYKQLYKSNVLTTKNLLESLLKINIERFIHFSSVSAMGPCKPYADEKVQCKPLTPYDKAKYESELVVKKYGEENGLPVTIIRPTMVYGPSEVKNKAKLFQLIQRQILPIIGNGKNLMSLVFIDNLIDGSFLAEKNKKAINQTYVISDEKPCTMNEFICTIARELKVRKPLHIPKVVAYSSAIFFETLARIVKKEPLLSFSRIRNLTSHHSFSIEKAKKELGYKPKINLRQGIKKTIRWYKQKGILK